MAKKITGMFGYEFMDKGAREQLNNIANKTVIENGKLYLVRKDGTKIDTGTTLPSSGTGTNGREVELQASTDYIQWRYVGDTDWSNLVELSSLKGADGDTGLSAYELAQQETGFAGTVEQWLNSLVGATPNLQIGTVETLESGSSATASITGTTENPLLNLGIPKGDTGASGTGTGGSSEKEWKLLADVTIEEEVNSIYFNTDADGNSFSIDEFSGFLELQNTTTGGGNGNLIVDPNVDVHKGSIAILGENFGGFFKNDTSLYKIYFAYNRITGLFQVASGISYTQCNLSQRNKFLQYSSKIESLIIRGSGSDMFFGIGTKLKMFGK